MAATNNPKSPVNEAEPVILPSFGNASPLPSRLLSSADTTEVVISGGSDAAVTTVRTRTLADDHNPVMEPFVSIFELVNVKLPITAALFIVLPAVAFVAALKVIVIVSPAEYIVSRSSGSFAIAVLKLGGAANAS